MGIKGTRRGYRISKEGDAARRRDSDHFQTHKRFKKGIGKANP